MTPGFRALLQKAATSYYADNYQQYLAKNPFGDRCHANAGVAFPTGT